MRYIVLIGTFILSVSFMLEGDGYIFAQTNNSLFVQANDLYRQGEYEKAKDIYEKLVFEKNIDSAELFYNLANCYFKTDNLGKAVLNYKRAFMIDPRDKLINDNLSFARGFIKFKVNDTRNWYIREGERILSYITLDELQVVLLILFLMIVILRLCLLLVKKGKILKRMSLFISIIFLISISALILKISPLFSAPEAVITSAGADVRYGPSTADKVAFRLSEGIEVIITSENNKWYKILLKSGKEGWIKDSSLEEVKWR